jgi:hypothetical protein
MGPIDQLENDLAAPMDYYLTCHRAKSPVELDGNVKKPVWEDAQWAYLSDMVTGAQMDYLTRVATLWDDTHFYIAFDLEEPFVSATMTQRDQLLFLENIVEVMIDGTECYYELQVNPLNTIYEVFFIWKENMARGCRFDVPEFDVYQTSAVTFGGDYDRSGPTFWRGTHPRGLRWAFLDYDMAGIRTAVDIDGHINDPTFPHVGWSVEIAIPWASMEWLKWLRSLPPAPNDIWRMFFGRFDQRIVDGVELRPHPAYALSRHGVYDTHLPERWPYVVFKG